MPITRERLIVNVFCDLGVDTSLKGYYYAKRGVELILEDVTNRNGFVVLYTKIGVEFHGDYRSIERAIRHMIKQAVKVNTREFVWRFGGARPTPSRFLTAIVENIRADDTALIRPQLVDEPNYAAL